MVTNDADLAEGLQSYTRLGNLKGIDAGANYKLNALAAALGLARLYDLQGLIDRRRDNATAVLDGLRSNPVLREIEYADGGRPNFYNLTLLLKNGGQTKTRNTLHRLNGAGITIDQIKYGYDVFYRRRAYSHVTASCPNAESMIDRLVQVPVHPGITPANLDYIISALKAVA